MELKCKKCGYGWDYMGKNAFYASCARCRTSVNIRKYMEAHNIVIGKKEECGHDIHVWRMVKANILELVCKRCRQIIKPEKIMITGFGIVKKEDIREIDVKPEKKT